MAVISPGSASDLRSSVPKIRLPLSRLIPAASALLCLGSALAVTALSSAREPVSLLVGIEAAGAATLFAVMMLARPQLVVPAVAAVAIPEGTSLALGGPAILAPVLGAALLAGAELAFWSIDNAAPVSESGRVVLFRCLRLLTVCLIGCALALALYALSDIPISGGFDLTVIGLVSAVGVMVVVLWLGRAVLGVSGKP
ncbi:MAG: hypothetical protein WB801_06225 [Candidatus Dormiibacterota bacterium]